MKNFIQEFKTFAMRGNVMDLAIGVVIGTAFSKIVSSLVDDIIMPTIGLFGKADFSEFVVADQIKLGMFINNILNLLIVALSIFMVIKVMNKLSNKFTNKNIVNPEIK